MTGYSYRYVGAESLPAKLSEFDLQQYFRLSREDVEALTSRFRADRRAGAAVQVLFFRTAGRPLDRFSTIPRTLLRYVGETLSVSAPTIASLRAVYSRRQTLYEHQAWAKQYLGLKDIDQAASDQLSDFLSAQANEVVSVDELVTSAQRWLYDRQLLIPAERTVRDLAWKCYDAIEKMIYATIMSVVPPATLVTCRQAVYGALAGVSGTVLEWLKTPPKAP